LNTLRRELRDKDGKWYQLRITPYRTTDNVIGGVVCTFNNITELKKNERVTQAALRFSESIVDTVNEPLIILDQTLQVSRVNMAFLEQFNTSREETVGKKLYRLGNKQWDIPELRKVLEEVLPQKNEIKNFVVEHDFPNIGAKRMYLNARAVPMEADEKQRILLAVTAVEDL
jgi:two-component system CheB/CheR fusion protein